MKSFNPYNTSHICPTPIPDTDLPPQRKTKSKRHPGHNNPSPRHTASISPPLPSSWTRPPPPLPYPTQQPTIRVFSLNIRHSSYRHHHPNAQQTPSSGCSNLSLPQSIINSILTSQPPENHCSDQPVHSNSPLIDTTSYTGHSTFSSLFCCNHTDYLIRNPITPATLFPI